MQTHNKFAKLAIFVVLGSLIVTLATLATAQSDLVGPIRASAATVPTNVLGIRTYAKPPGDFNPLMATDAELAVYGFPQRPDTQAHPDQYAEWERAIKAAKTRWSGDLKPLPAGEHGMIPSGSLPLPEAAQQQTSGPKHISTNNASGVIVSGGTKDFYRRITSGWRCRDYRRATGSDAVRHYFVYRERFRSIQFRWDRRVRLQHR